MPVLCGTVSQSLCLCVVSCSSPFAFVPCFCFLAENPWEDDVPLSANAAQADDMTATVYFPPGTFLYKFVVDGEWRFVSHVAIQVRGGLPPFCVALANN